MTVDYLCSGMQTFPFQADSFEMYRTWIIYKLISTSKSSVPQIQNIIKTNNCSESIRQQPLTQRITKSSVPQNQKAVKTDSCPVLVRRKSLGHTVTIRYKYREIDYIPKWKAKNRDAAKVFSKIASTVIQKLKDLSRSSLQASEKLVFGFRHFLFLRGEYNSLSKLNNQFSTEKYEFQEYFFEDFQEYLKSVFCKVKVVVPSVQVINYDIAIAKRNYGLVHAKSIFDDRCILGTFLTSHQRSIKKYIAEVLFFEGLVLYLQDSTGSSYLDVSKRLGFKG